MTMIHISDSLVEIRRRLMVGNNGDPVLLHDMMIELVDAVSSIAVEVEKNKSAARHAAETASCLANGIKPD